MLWAGPAHLLRSFGSLLSPYVDRMWLWVCYNKIPIHPIFYLLKTDHMSENAEAITGLKSSVPCLAVAGVGFRGGGIGICRDDEKENGNYSSI